MVGNTVARNRRGCKGKAPLSQCCMGYHLTANFQGPTTANMAVTESNHQTECIAAFLPHRMGVRMPEYVKFSAVYHFGMVFILSHHSTQSVWYRWQAAKQAPTYATSHPTPCTVSYLMSQSVKTSIHAHRHDSAAEKPPNLHPLRFAWVVHASIKPVPLAFEVVIPVHRCHLVLGARA